ncbi:MAG: LysR substrate-binding domain-containing protein [Alphaproteobacteria bacterium]|nr:LysR substrate-binding domain-containing protein [Alphaproteobacteria bacterium]
MARKHYNLPPLTTLASFEAAARHLSFKDAAGELNVTPGAVSHQIKALEKEIGVGLFVRRHRGVALTDQGQALFTVLQGSFGKISATLTRLRRSSDDAAVTIAASTAVSSLWLTPRLTSFWKSHGSIPVNQQVSDRTEYNSPYADLQIRYGDIDADEAVKFPLFRDVLIPVCSPNFAAAHREAGLEALARMPLIHPDADNTSWTTWHAWFTALGYRGEIAKGLQVNNYTIALQAARDDVGVVLGWQRLVKPYLERQVLVPLGTNRLPAPASFYIVSEPDELISANARTVRDWLLENV